jgi:hypothetical protein
MGIGIPDEIEEILSRGEMMMRKETERSDVLEVNIV